MSNEVTKDVEIARVIQPKFLTLTGKPANQVAFKVIRDDNGETTMTAPHIARKRNTRRSDALISIEFSLDTEDDTITQTMNDWGIADYKIEVTAEQKVVRCSDAPEGAATMQVKLSDEATATILKPISQRSDNAKPNISVAAIEFAPDYFPDVADISAWCQRNNIDFSDDAVENGAQQTILRSMQVDAGEETRKVEVDDGVQFVVVRSEVQAVPQDFIAVVNDTAYGSWGWGQLDFGAAIADKMFCNAADEAIYTLRNLADRIIFYSDLPISVRKDLIKAAANQFSDYVVALMDALPARVVIANRSILEKEKSMSKEKGQGGQTAQRTDDQTGAAAAAAAAKTDTPNGDGITRADVEKMIGDAVGGLSVQIADLKTSLTAPAAGDGEGDSAQRSDGTAGEGDSKQGDGDAGSETLKQILRSMQDLGESVKGVAERVNTLEGSTVVRSDAGDAKQVERKDVFKGMFGKQSQQA